MIEGIKFEANRPLTGQLSASRFNQIVRQIRLNRPIAGNGISVTQTGDGIRITAGKSAGGFASQGEAPWDIYIKDSQTEGEGEGAVTTYTLAVRAGTLAGVLPSNILTYEKVGVPDDQFCYGIAKVTTDGQFVTDVQVEISTDQPAQQIPTAFGLQTNIEILFGIFDSGAAYNLTTGTGNIDVKATNVMASPKQNTAPGEPLFDLFYLLQ